MKASSTAPVKRTLLISIDGLRPDSLHETPTPALHSLMDRGAFSLAARTVMPSITLPVHVSMFHGVLPEMHGVITNLFSPVGQHIPGMMDLVRQSGRLPVAFTTWEPLRDLSRPGTLAHSALIDIYGPEGHRSDQAIAEQAASYLVEASRRGACPDFTFLYLGLTDEIGHRHGWMSPEYLQTVSQADQAVAHILQALDGAGLLAETAVLVLSDHGGHEKSHGSDLPEDMTIPWILSGPGVKAGCTLNDQVQVIDTAPTLAYLLGLPIPPIWQGRVVTEALEDQP